jgi:tryptophan synthase alpha chain
MSRIDETFASLRRQGRCGLVTFVTAGDPDLARSAEIILGLDRGGADVLEIGVPFSDPLADGPVIQRASERAIAAGSTLTRTLELIRGLRPRLRAPVVLFSYANPIVQMGVGPFARQAADAGVDGVLVLDWPPEESGELGREVRAAGLARIFLVSPTTSSVRLRLMTEEASGFVYAISRLGVTGAKQELARGIGDLAGRIRAVTALPIAVGFGVSRPDHVSRIAALADAAVVGSALVQFLADRAASPDLGGMAARYVRWLRGEVTEPDREEGSPGA